MATNYTNTTFKVFSDKMGERKRSEYVGNAGEIFYDPVVPELFLSDGITPGGIPILGSSTVDISAYYTKLQVDQLFTNIIGDATANGDTLGELEDRIEINNININNLANTINNYVDQDHQTLSFDPNTNILTISNGNSVDLTPLSQTTTSQTEASLTKLTLFSASADSPQNNGDPVKLGTNIYKENQTVSQFTSEFSLSADRLYSITVNFQWIRLASTTGSVEVWLVDKSDPSTALDSFVIRGRDSSDGGFAITSSQYGNFLHKPTADITAQLVFNNCTSGIVAYEGSLSIHTIGG